MKAQDAMLKKIEIYFQSKKPKMNKNESSKSFIHPQYYKNGHNGQTKDFGQTLLKTIKVTITNITIRIHGKKLMLEAVEVNVQAGISLTSTGWKENLKLTVKK